MSEAGTRPDAAERLGGAGSVPPRSEPARLEHVTDDVDAMDAEARARQEKYDALLRLADLFDATGEQLRERSRLGDRILAEPEVADSAPVAPRTWKDAEDEIRHATSGKGGLLGRSVELDADALVLRATVLTYRWIDDLQDAAYKTLGAIAGRAIGYLAPEVELGGAIVSAGLIETDALDRDGVAAYLGELAENNPELLDHVTSGGGGLLDSLQMRSLLAAGVLAGADGPAAARGGLRAAGVAPFGPLAVDALRDMASDATSAPQADDARGATSEAVTDEAPPGSLEELITRLAGALAPVSVSRVGQGRYVAYLPGPGLGEGARRSLVSGDQSAYTTEVLAGLERTLAAEDDASVMLVGAGQGGVSAVEIAANRASTAFTVEQVVTAGAPGSHAYVVPPSTRVLSLEDRADPVALLGSLLSHDLPHRLTVVFDSGGEQGIAAYVVGARAADAADHLDLRAELDRLTERGYLAP